MTVQQVKIDKRVHIPATAVTIGLMLLFPFIVQLIGGSTASGGFASFTAYPLVND